MATMFVDADEWEARAHSLGGTSNALLAGLAARLASEGTGHRRRLGRLEDPGQRAHRRRYSRQRGQQCHITVDPAPATTDLREIRAAIKQALIRHREVPDEEQAMLSLVIPCCLSGSSGCRQCDQRRLIQPRCGQPGRQPARWHGRRLLRHEASLPGRDQGNGVRFGGLQFLVSGRACDRSLSRSLRISRAVPTRMTACDMTFRAP